MFTSRIIKLRPQDIQIAQYTIGKNLKKARENLAFVQNRYDHWDEITDERILSRYTKEEYKERYITHWQEEIEYLESHLERVSKGYDFE